MVQSLVLNVVIVESSDQMHGEQRHESLALSDDWSDHEDDDHEKGQDLAE